MNGRGRGVVISGRAYFGTGALFDLPGRSSMRENLNLRRISEWRATA
jgi:hypothetical protein